MKKLELENALRNKYLEIVMKALAEVGEDVGICGSNMLNFPTLDDEDNEKAIEIVIKVKKDEDYDCYEMREEYDFKVAESKRKAEEKAKEKERKKLADEKKRAEKQTLKDLKKAERELAKGE